MCDKEYSVYVDVGSFSQGRYKHKTVKKVINANNIVDAADKAVAEVKKNNIGYSFAVSMIWENINEKSVQKT